MKENQQLELPKNIRQIGAFGDTYKVYVEDFVYTYVHQFMHRRKKEDAVLAAVLLGRAVRQDGQEYVFISGAQKVDFCLDRQPDSEQETGKADQENALQEGTDAVLVKQQEFWERVYQGIKQYFSGWEIQGWYFNLDGSALEIPAQLRQFFESTFKKGSRFLYFEDSVEKQDAFFVQEQHKLQRLSGYAVYYEKNPVMQEFMIAENEKSTPKPLRDTHPAESREDVAQNYRAIMNKLNEKPPKKKIQPVIYVAGAAVLAIVAATGVTQIGNYQNLKVLEQTMQTLSGSVASDGEEDTAQETPDALGADGASGTDQGASLASTDQTASLDGTGQTSSSDGTGTDQTSASDGTGTDQALASDGTDSGQTSSSGGTDTASSGSSESAQETASSPANYYIVKKGDSLVSISKALYNDTSMVEEICSLNDIENMDVIYEGQKLLLP